MSFLANAKSSSAGWHVAINVDNPWGDPVVTALAVRAYAAVRSSVPGHEPDWDAAAGYLQTLDPSSWSALQRAHVALALLRWLPDPTSADSLLAGLEAAQDPAGHWDGDPYVTAVVLQALAARLGTDAPFLQEDVSIPDLGLRTAINLTLGRNRLDAISRGAMRTLVTLDARNLGIENLAGIEEAESLTVINLLGNDIADLSPLDSLPNLTIAIVSEPCDVDADGAIRAADAQKVLRAIATGTPLSVAERTAADVTPLGSPDGVLTAADALDVTRAAAGYSVPACGN